jgi:zinc transport system substrate-binding protein
MGKMLKIILAVFLVLTVVFLLVMRGLGTFDQNKLQVVASFYPLYFFASEVGKDRAQVKNITPAGAEPHDYEPTTAEVALIEHADMLILNGQLEAWGDRVGGLVKNKNTDVVVAGEGLIDKDPHVWLSPRLALKQANKIAEGYEKIDPPNRSYYEINRKNLEDRFNQLDADYINGLSNCRKRDIVTSHAAFGYVAKEYGFNQISISGLSPDEEPSPQKMVEIAKIARDKNIKYIFFESLVSSKLSETIAREVGAKTLVLNPIEGLSDEQISAGENYFSVMRENLKNLRLALECE